ncbi:MARVEL domain-containing protein [Aphelenchoides fujianensis]|nr:MARVEL domain-containing protein [Aphelenchoides fujianensis]
MPTSRLQVTAILLLICLGAATPVDGSGVLWFIALTSMFISVVATVLFMLDKNEPVLVSITGGLITWNVAEFVYSTILTVLCAISVWLSFGYAGHVPDGGHSNGYVFAGIFLIIQTAFYAIPAVLIYEKVQFRQDDDPTARMHFASDDPGTFPRIPLYFTNFSRFSGLYQGAPPQPPTQTV